MTKRNANQVQQTAQPSTTGNPAVDTAIQDVKNALGSVAGMLNQPLTPVERSRLARVRRQGQQMVGPLITLATQKPGLVPVGSDPQALAQEQVKFTQLHALSVTLTAASKGVADTVDQLESDLWTAALDIYAIASRSTADDPEIAEVVAQMKAALARGSKPKYKRVPIDAPTGTASTTAPGTTTSAGSTTPTSTTPASGNGNGTSSNGVPVYTPTGVSTSTNGKAS